jgi:hypothetical protein
MENITLTTDNIHFVRINPAAEADMGKLNEVLFKASGYIEGLKFTHSEVTQSGQVQFYFDYPDTLSPAQERDAKDLVKKIYAQFMADRVEAK